MKVKITGIVLASLAGPALGGLTLLASAPSTIAASLAVLGALAGYWIAPNRSFKVQVGQLPLTQPLTADAVPKALQGPALGAQALIDQACALVETLKAQPDNVSWTAFEPRIARAQRVLNDTVNAFSQLTPLDTVRFSRQIETLCARELIGLVNELQAARSRPLEVQGKLIEAIFPEKTN